MYRCGNDPLNEAQNISIGRILIAKYYEFAFCYGGTKLNLSRLESRPGPWGQGANIIYKNLSVRLTDAMRDQNARIYLTQRVCIRYN